MIFGLRFLKYVRKLRITSVLLKVTPTTRPFSLCFSDHYKQLYNPVEFPSCEWKELYSYVCNDIVSDCNNRDSFTVTINAIINAIKHLKPRKGDGFDGLSTDYVINGSPLLSEYLSWLFTCMLSHCFIPTSFSVSTMVKVSHIYVFNGFIQITKYASTLELNFQ